MRTLSRVATPAVRPNSHLWRWLRRWLLVSGIIGILAAIAIPLYENI
jgi:hypothetical protein